MRPRAHSSSRSSVCADLPKEDLARAQPGTKPRELGKGKVMMCKVRGSKRSALCDRQEEVVLGPLPREPGSGEADWS